MTLGGEEMGRVVVCGAYAIHYMVALGCLGGYFFSTVRAIYRRDRRAYRQYVLPLHYGQELCISHPC